ncbi:MAG: quinone oxidoreductase [Bryobacterales bacterium]|nr:quinone oxidoreductase [Bryobacterales bacterium]
MKAIRIHEHGGPEVLSYEDLPEPEPGPGQAVVKIEAAGVNFIDIYFRTGLYPAELPITNGQEGAGTVVAVGEGVTEVSVGDRVAYTGAHGAYAQFAAVAADRLVSLPDEVSTKLAAASMLQGMTAHYLIRSTFEVNESHTVLIHACAGGVGLLLVQMAKKFGARVIGTCSTPEKAARAREAGADEVILYTERDFESECKRLTGNQGVDVVYDAVGKSTWVGSLNSLKPRGMMVTFGNASGPVPPLAPLELTKRGSLYLTRPSLFAYVSSREDLEWRSSDIFEWIRDGELRIHVGGEFPLRDAAEAQTRLAGRKTMGKLVLIP